MREFCLICQSDFIPDENLHMPGNNGFYCEECILRAGENGIELLEALERAVALYGKEGGPWNVPSDPGSWITLAHQAIKKAKGE